jgi:hypothetical protein
VICFNWIFILCDWVLTGGIIINLMLLVKSLTVFEKLGPNSPERLG